MSDIEFDAAFVFSRLPFTDLTFQEGLDAAFAFAAFDQRVCLFFTGDSVWALNRDNKPEITGNRDFLSQLGALALYGIEHLFVSQTALQQRGLDATRLRIQARPLADARFARMLQQCRLVFRF
jgi:tRNA 2-thiouridine synthesizing protein C